MGELCAEELVGLADPAGNVVGRRRRGAMPIGGGGRVSVPDPRFGLHAFREFVQHVQDAVIPASLPSRFPGDRRPPTCSEPERPPALPPTSSSRPKSPEEQGIELRCGSRFRYQTPKN